MNSHRWEAVKIVCYGIRDRSFAYSFCFLICYIFGKMLHEDKNESRLWRVSVWIRATQASPPSTTPLPPLRISYTLQTLVRQNTVPIDWQCAAAVKLRQQLLLLGHQHRTARAGQVEGFCPQRKPLDQGFRVTVEIQHSHRPERPRLEEVLATEVKEGHLILHGRLYIGDQCQNMGDRNLVMCAQAAAVDAPRSFYDPEVLAQFSTIAINLKLLCPENDQSVQAIDALAGEAVMPAIDKPHGLGTPAPVATWTDLGIHSSLYSIEITHLLEQRLVINAAHVGVQRAQQHGNARARGMYRALAEIKEAGKIQWGQVGRVGIVLHLLVATRHRVCTRLRDIIEP